MIYQAIIQAKSDAGVPMGELVFGSSRDYDLAAKMVTEHLSYPCAMNCEQMLVSLYGKQGMSYKFIVRAL